MRVLVVDDKCAVRDALARVLRADGYEVELADDGEAGLAAASAWVPHTVVLDVILPGLDGLEVCRRLRAAGDRVPVLIVTACDTVSDRVAGLDAGADDYLVKPFSTSELRARVRALLRRAGWERPERLRFSDLELNAGGRLVYRRQRRVELTRREFALLELFLRNPGLALSRSVILDRVWGLDFPAASRVLEVYVGHLRRKLEASGEARLLQTVRGVGYVLREEP
jgi:two-component system response regulator MprA